MVQSAKGSLYKVDGEGATRGSDSWGLHGSQGEQWKVRAPFWLFRRFVWGMKLDPEMCGLWGVVFLMLMAFLLWDGEFTWLFQLQCGRRVTWPPIFPGDQVSAPAWNRLFYPCGFHPPFLPGFQWFVPPRDFYIYRHPKTGVIFLSKKNVGRFKEAAKISGENSREESPWGFWSSHLSKRMPKGEVVA